MPEAGRRQVNVAAASKWRAGKFFDEAWRIAPPGWRREEPALETVELVLRAVLRLSLRKQREPPPARICPVEQGLWCVSVKRREQEESEQ